MCVFISTYKLLLDVIRLEKKGYCCSQIMILFMLKSRHVENPDLVRAMAGLCNGVGFSGEICRILTGGACLLSLCAGKGRMRRSPTRTCL